MNGNDIIRMFNELPMTSIASFYLNEPDVTVNLSKFTQIVEMLQDKLNEMNKSALSLPAAFCTAFAQLHKSDMVQFLVAAIETRLCKSGFYIGFATLLGITRQIVVTLKEDTLYYLYYKGFLSGNDVNLFYDVHSRENSQLFPDQTIYSNVSRCVGYQALQYQTTSARPRIEHTFQNAGKLLRARAVRKFGIPEIIDDDVDWLRQKFTNPNFVSKRRQTPLIDQAARFGAIRCFKFLLVNGCPVSPDTMAAAVMGNNVEIVQLLRERDLKLDSSMVSHAITSFNQPVLEYIVGQASTTQSITVAVEACNFQAYFFLMSHLKPSIEPTKHVSPSMFSCAHVQKQDCLDYVLAKICDDDSVSPWISSSDSSTAILFDSVNILSTLPAVIDSPSYFRQAYIMHANRLCEHYISMRPRQNGLSDFFASGVDVIEQLVDGGYRPTTTDISDAIRFGNIKIVKYLTDIVPCDADAISQAIQSGSLVVLEYIVKLGFPIRDDCLLLAASLVSLDNMFLIIDSSGLYVMLKFLLGSHTFTQAALDESLIMCAHIIQCVHVLQRHGADINAVCHDSTALLHCLSNSYKIELASVIHSLIKSGTNPNLDRPTTPLLHAIDISQQCVEVMLDNGADPNHADAQGRTPLEAVASLSGVRSKEHLMQALFQAGADEIPRGIKQALLI